MLGVLLVPLVFGFVLVPAVILLAARDGYLRRIREEQRPLADRIAGIRADADFMACELRNVLKRPNPSNRPVEWIGPVIVYYQRLESLAAAPDPSLDEIRRLAEEATTYTREHQLKGIRVGYQAEKLALLVGKRGEA